VQSPICCLYCSSVLVFPRGRPFPRERGGLRASFAVGQGTPRVHTYTRETAARSAVHSTEKSPKKTIPESHNCRLWSITFSRNSLQQILSLLLNQWLAIIQYIVVSNSQSKFQYYPLEITPLRSNSPSLQPLSGVPPPAGSRAAQRSAPQTGTPVRCSSHPERV